MQAVGRAVEQQGAAKSSTTQTTRRDSPALDIRFWRHSLQAVPAALPAHAKKHIKPCSRGGCAVIAREEAGRQAYTWRHQRFLPSFVTTAVHQGSIHCLRAICYNTYLVEARAVRPVCLSGKPGGQSNIQKCPRQQGCTALGVFPRCTALPLAPQHLIISFDDSGVSRTPRRGHGIREQSWRKGAQALIP